MSIEIRFLDDGIGVCWFGQGVITGQDLLEASKETFKEVFVDQIGWTTRVFRSKTEAKRWIKELIPEFCTKDRLLDHSFHKGREEGG